MAETTTVRVSRHTHAALSELASKSNRSIQQLLGEMVEQERTRQFWDEVDAAFLALRNDPAAWAEELAERALWEQTLADGLQDDE